MMKTAKTYGALHLILMLYSLSSVCSKLAGQAEFMSLRFILCYGGTLFLLFLYAIAWQQIIKALPLTLAFANKAMTVVWGIVWGVLIFQESVTPGKLLGVALIIAGIILFSASDKETENQDG